MQLFKKTISLNQAAKISGYAQDYLGYLIRNGELKGTKKGGIWFTTEGDVKSYISKQKSLHKKSNIKKPVFTNPSNFSSPLFARNISVYALILLVGFSSVGFYLFGKYNNQVRTFATASVVATKNFAVASAQFSHTFSIELANNWERFSNGILDSGISSLNNQKQLSLSLSHTLTSGYNSIGDGVITTGEKLATFSDRVSSVLVSSKELGGELFASASSSGISIIEFGNSIWNGITSGVNSFLALFSSKEPTTPQIIVPKSLVNTKVTPKISQTPSVPLSGETNTTPKVASSVVNNITQQQRTTYINQYDPAIIPRIIGIEKALTNEIAFNSLQVDRIYYSLGRSITSSSDNITEDGTLNDSTLNRPKINNAVITSSTFEGTTVTATEFIGHLTGNITGGAGSFTTLTSSGNTSLGGDLTVTGTAWTATPTISGLLTATSGLTSNGTVTIQNNSNFIQSGTGTFSTGTGAISINGPTTISGQTTLTHRPTLAHLFSTWPTGTSNVSDSTIYINPSSSIANGNLIGASVADVVKFIVDAEGNIYGNSVILTGSVTSGSTTVASLSVLDNTTLGDAGTDIVTIHGVTTLDNTFTVSGANLTTLGGNLTVTGTAWTATPTISGLITATSGLTSNGTLTANGTVALGDGGDNVTINSNVWDVSSTGAISGITTIGVSDQITSTLAIGTSPFAVTSTTLNTNLNADLLDDQQGSYYAPLGNISGTDHYIAKFNGTSALENSLLFDNGTNVGIGTTTPRTKLELNGDGALLAIGTFGSGWAEPTLGAGTRMIWYPKKAAFRAGYVSVAQWNDGSIGNYSVAMGQNTQATNDNSFAMGYATRALGAASVALGYNTLANGSYGTALGYNTTASGFYSTAIGYYTSAAAGFSTTMGYYTTANGQASVAIGDHTTTGSYASLAIGRYNVGGGTVDSWVSTDPVFEIGNGTGTGVNASNALTVLKNGNVGIGDTTPASLFTVGASDAFQVNSTGAIVASTGLTSTGNVTLTGANITGASPFSFDGNTVDTIKTIFAITDPTITNKTITFPDANITVNAAADISGTTLSSNVVTSSLTTVGALNAGSITSGFGAIDVGADGITTTGTIGTASTTTFTGAGATFSSNLAANGGITNAGALSSTGGIVSLNDSSNYATNIGTGTSTGIITIGNATVSDLALNDAQWSITGAGVANFASVGNGTAGSGAFTTLSASSTGNALTLSGAGANIYFSGAGLAQITTVANQNLAIMPGGTGNVGIGTTGPQANLDVSSNTAQTLLNVTNQYGNFQVQKNGYDAYLNLHDAGQFVFRNGVADVERMRISSTGGLSVGNSTWSGTDPGAGNVTIQGNVGIGTTGPRARLEVNTGLPSAIPTYLDTTSGFKVTDGGAIYGRLGTAQIAGAGYPTYLQAGDRDGAAYYNILLNPLGGNVGIGTTEPTDEKLVVSGNIKVFGAAPYINFGTAVGSTDWHIKDTGSATYDLGFYPVSSGVEQTPSLYLKASGNVGIGTTNPTTQLMVTGAAQATTAISDSGTFGGSLFVQDTGISGGSGGMILLGTNQSLTGQKGIIAGIKANVGDAAAYTSGSLSFSTRNISTDVALTERMRITSTGNVGIGTTGPQAKLVVSDAGANGFEFFPATIPYIQSYDRVNSVYRDLAIQTAGGAVGSQFIVKATTGNVGIGTTAPGAKLDIASTPGYDATVNAAGILRLLSLSDRYPTFPGSAVGIQFGARGNTAESYRYGNRIISQYVDDDPKAYNLYFQTSTAADTWGTQMTIQGINGNVGIGTTGPGAKLDIQSGTGYELKFSGTDGANIYSPDQTLLILTGTSQTLEFGSNGVNSQMVLKDGNVGIGTTAPGEKLQVAGAIKTTGAVSANLVNSTTLSQEATGGMVGSWGPDESTRGALSFYIARSNGGAGLTAMKIDNTGNVGIGTTNPIGKLSVSNGQTTTTNIIFGEVLAGQYAQIIWDNTANKLLTLSAENAGSIAFNTGDEKMRILNNGNVGIGTTGPDTRLHVLNDGTTPSLTLEESGTALDSATLTQFQDATGTGQVQLGWRRETDHFKIQTTGAMTNAGFSASADFVINSTGNVGIGTTGPQFRLVVGGGVSNEAISIYSPTAASSLYFSDALSGAGSTAGIIDYYHSTDTMMFGTNGTHQMVINNLGNVGIGTTAPNGKLDVNGNVRFATGSDTTGDVTGAVFIGSDSTRNIDGRYSTAIKTINTASNPNFLQPRMGFFTQDTSTYLPSDLIERMSILANNGNVGIGTTDPLATLHVLRTTVGEVARFRTTGADALADVAIVNDAQTWGFRVDGGDSDKFKIMNFQTSTPTLTIQTNGNVGIGTTDPDFKLKVVGPQAYLSPNYPFNMMSLDSATTFAQDIGGGIGFGGYKDGSIESYWAGIHGGKSNSVSGEISGNLQFYTRDTGAIAEVMRITNKGNVGIGTTGPTVKLEVRNTTSDAINAFTSSTSSGNVAVYGGHTGASVGSAYGGMFQATGASLTNVGVYTSATGATNNRALFITGTPVASTNYAIYSDAAAQSYIAGNVGIGTTAPTGKLDVAGAGDAIIQMHDGGAITWTNGTTNKYGIFEDSATRSLNFYRVGVGTDMIIKDGNVGIGTTGPNEKLEVNGAGLFTGSLINYRTSSVALDYFEDGARLISFGADGSTAGTIKFINSANDGSPFNESMTILGNGNVGIGTTGPGSKLVVQDSSNREPSLVTGAVSGFLINNAGQEISMGASGVSPYPSFIQSRGGGIAYPLVLNPLGGNVGIGTTGPGAKLDIQSGTGYELKFSGTDGANIYSPDQTLLILTGTSQTLEFGSNGVNSQMVLKDGNVGIGTTGPLALLDITVPSSKTTVAASTAAFMRTNDADNPFALRFRIVGAAALANRYAELQTTDYASVDGGNLVLQPATGNVGIGTTNPTHLITLSGGAYSDGANWTDVSDKNLKENFTPLNPQSVLTKIIALPVEQWNYKSQSADNLHIGAVAQDFYSAFGLGGANGATSISPMDTGGVALIGIQALNLNLGAISGTITPVAGSTQESFMNSFFNNLYAKVTTWLASAGNGIGDLYASAIKSKTVDTKELNTGNVNTDTLCVSDASGAKTCINKAQLDTFIAYTGATSSGSLGDGGDDGIVEKTPGELLQEANAKITALVKEIYTSESWDLFIIEKDKALLLLETNDVELLAKVKAIDDALVLLKLKPVPPTCTLPQILEGDACVTPVLTCTPPQVPVEGVCADPI